MYRYTNIQKFVTLMYLKEVSYALHLFNQNIVKTVILWNVITSIN